MTVMTFLDVETSGFTDEPSRVIELATRQIIFNGPGRASDVGPIRAATFGLPKGFRVSPRASAVHHLTDTVLVGKPTFDVDTWRRAAGAADYLVAHNAEFDRGQIAAEVPAATEARWLCTMKLSRVAWPDSPSHGLQVLRYYLGLTGELPDGLAPHRAAYDVAVGGWLLVALLEHFEGDLDEMLRVSSRPSLLPRVGFGKNRGRPWREMDEGFLRWVLRQDFDEDVKFTATHWLSPSIPSLEMGSKP